MNLFDLKKEQKAALDAAETILKSAETSNRGLTVSETEQYNKHMDAFRDFGATVQARQEQNTIRSAFGPNGFPKWLHDPAATRIANRNQKQMSTDYAESFLSFIRSGGKHATGALSEGFDSLFGGFALPALPGMSAASYEGSSGSGGAALSTPTEPNIVSLGVPDLAVRSIASVIATTNPVRIPRGTAFPTASIKAEGDGTGTNIFTTSSSTYDNFLLDAFMIGVANPVSFELMSDVPTFQSFAVTDLVRSVNILEESYFVTGSGNGQPQGLQGAVGTGTGTATAVESTGAYLLQSTSDVIGSLKSVYHPNAGWLMNRKTGAAIRKAQTQANLFAPIWTRENGRDFLHGYPVSFSQNMPDLPSATSTGVTPILFGSFPDGYIIGDRGGSGVFVKILDQPKATEGLVILLCYKRVDGRVRRSEALQGVSISHA